MNGLTRSNSINVFRSPSPPSPGQMPTPIMDISLRFCVVRVAGMQWLDHQFKEPYYMSNMILYLSTQCQHRDIHSRKTSCVNQTRLFRDTASVHFPIQLINVYADPLLQ